ncbi:hypothetical protein ACKE5C_19140 (plasmid) [Aneurinibacillus thermoaerophilus]|uniref:Uncharacterized protein n=1 Tax=Aneurinibacillus thermoaerophilus TaxID=143495 RepID=A0ABX8YG33_ANETH|nr:hypothetical protein [Aneurinibacillus thermoaerophilus]QYY44777.1 hypothetical protein K3F53_18760 [Aneurinibacillus thermoaerophilus]
MSLANLIEQVRSQIRDTKEPYVFAREVPATETSPAVPDELETFVMRAVHDYSRWRPLKKRGTLSIVPGEVEYVLPNDFIQIDNFVLNVGFDPLQYRVLVNKIYLIQPPIDREDVIYYYDALHTPDTIPAYDEPAIVSLAAAMALRAIVGDPKMLHDYISYDLEGVVKINTENMTEAIEQILKAAQQLEEQYSSRIVTSQKEEKNSPFMTFG